MRIQYTLPSLQASTAAAAGQKGGDASFRGTLRRLAEPLPVSWKGLLRLDRVPASPGSIGAPPKPQGLEVRDVASERLRFRNLLERHSQDVLGSRGSPQSAADVASVQRMLTLLSRYQNMQDRVVAQHLTETRG